MTKTILKKKIHSLFPMKVRKKKIDFIGKVVSEKDMFENNGHIHVCSPWTGARQPIGIIVFLRIYYYSVNLLICCKFFSNLLLCNSCFSIQMHMQPNPVVK